MPRRFLYNFSKLIAVALFCVTSTISNAEQLFIGLDADVSGNSKIGGIAIKRGAQLAIDEINASGGIKGKQLSLLIRDHKGNPARGLTISKQLTTLMDGEISIESELDKGSTFTLRLETQLYGTNDSDLATQARSAPEFKLAYFDQSEVSRTSVLQQLQAWQVDVYAEVQQPALLEEIAKHSFDALIFCSTAPVDDAATFISCVRKASNSAIKVAMVTTLTELQQSQHLNKLALDTYFAKPITPDNLNDALASFKSDQPDTSSPDDRKAPKIDSGHSDVNGASVLLVEDNPTHQIIALTLLEGLGLSVGVADHGQDALTRLK